MNNNPNCPPPPDWDFAKDGTWLTCAHGNDFIPVYGQTRPDVEPSIIGAYTPERAVGLALGLLRAVSELDTHQQLIAAIEDAFRDTDDTE